MFVCFTLVSSAINLIYLKQLILLHQNSGPPCANQSRSALFILKIIYLCYKTSYLNVDVNCNEPSPSVSIPWPGIYGLVCKFKKLSKICSYKHLKYLRYKCFKRFFLTFSQKMLEINLVKNAFVNITFLQKFCYDKSYKKSLLNVLLILSMFRSCKILHKIGPTFQQHFLIISFLSLKLVIFAASLSERSHNTQHNDTQHNDTQHNDTQHRGRSL